MYSVAEQSTTLKDQQARSCNLSQSHRRTLLEDSSIAAAIVSERGVRTITRGRDLPGGFSRRQRQRGPGILFTVHRPNGETSHSFRPDSPDPDDTGRKYEQPSKHYGGAGNVLDVHPSCRHLIGRTDVPVIFVEGIKKGDSILSAAKAAGVEVLVVAISGVWNWLHKPDETKKSEPIPDMSNIALEGREATVCFDSDMLQNPQVQDAARRLAEHLNARGAETSMTFLPDKPDGSKMGADDFLAGGGTLAELRLLTRRYDPADFERVRLSRDEKLRAGVEDLEHRAWAHKWKGQGGHSDRDVYLKLAEAARRHGKPTDRGVRVVKCWGALELEARVSRRTLWKALNRLEEAGLISRDNEGRKADKSGAFVLHTRLAGVNHNEEEQGQEKKATRELQTLSHGGLHLRAPRLRWSAPAYKPRRGTVRGAEGARVRQGPLPEARPAIKRLGKVRGAILDVLDVAGGTATLQEIADALHRKRPRDLRKRNLPMLEEAEIVVVDGDVVRLADDWLDKLEAERERGGEIEAEESARRRLALKSRAFHSRRKYRPGRSVSDEQLAAQRERAHEAMQAHRDACEERRRAAALEAFRASGSGARKNLRLCMDGELANVEALVKSVLAYHRVPFSQWEKWREPVLEAGTVIAREASPGPPPDRHSDWRTHPLDCECDDCLYPEPRYAKGVS